MNKPHLIGATLTLATIALAVIAAVASGHARESFLSNEAIAHKRVAPSLFDPSSAQFRHLSTRDGVLCGEVNAKNRYGAYVGFRPFFALYTDVRIGKEGEPITHLTALC